MKKQILYAPLTETSTAVVNKIYVSNIVELYAAINDLANAGKTIVLAPGTYVLSPNYPKGGSLELQHNMSLVGQTDHPELAIIDAGQLVIFDTNHVVVPAFAKAPSPGNPFVTEKGVIRMGYGKNTLEWLTLQNDPNQEIRSLIETDGISIETNVTPTNNAKIRIANTIIKSSNIGINIINWRTESNGRIVKAEIENNEITINNINSNNKFRSAIQIQNSHGVSGALIKATLKENYLQGGLIGIWVLNGQASQNDITVKSYNDIIENNDWGLDFRTGLSKNRPLFPGDNNSILFEAHGSAIRNNLAGGVFATAGFMPATQPLVLVNNNQLNISFHNCPIANNTNGDQINVYGAYSPSPSITPAGSNNKTELHLHGVSSQATVNAINSFPDEPAGTNTVTASS